VWVHECVHEFVNWVCVLCSWMSWSQSGHFVEEKTYVCVLSVWVCWWACECDELLWPGADMIYYNNETHCNTPGKDIHVCIICVSVLMSHHFIYVSVTSAPDHGCIAVCFIIAVCHISSWSQVYCSVCELSLRVCWWVINSSSHSVNAMSSCDQELIWHTAILKHTAIHLW